jgi:hypothetical protein
MSSCALPPSAGSSGCNGGSSLSLESSYPGTRNRIRCIGQLNSIHLFSHTKRQQLFDSLQCLMQDLMSASLRSSISGSGQQTFFEVQFPENLVRVLIYPFSRNHPDDNSKSPVSFDNMLEIFNQLGIYIGKKDFKKNSGPLKLTESFLRSQKPNYIKWQQAWKNSIKHYTPCMTPEYDNVPVEGVIEIWDPRLKASQIKTIKISPMFGADVLLLYKEANEAHPAPAVVKSQEAAESLRTVVSMYIKFMLVTTRHGCSQMMMKVQPLPVPLPPVPRW